MTEDGHNKVPWDYARRDSSSLCPTPASLSSAPDFCFHYDYFLLQESWREKGVRLPRTSAGETEGGRERERVRHAITGCCLVGGATPSEAVAQTRVAAMTAEKDARRKGGRGFVAEQRERKRFRKSSESEARQEHVSTYVTDSSRPSTTRFPDSISPSTLCSLISN